MGSNNNPNLVISTPTNSYICKKIYCRYEKDTSGHLILDFVCDHLNIPQEDRRFFGLEISVSASSTRHSKWVRTEKLIRKQVISLKSSDGNNSSSSLPKFNFTLKVFPTKTSHPNHEISRQYCCYVIRRLVREQKLFPSRDRLVQLAACTMQSLNGDYIDPKIFKTKIRDFHKLELPEELVPATEQMYRRMAGTNPALAEELFLGYAHNIDLYGVHLFDVRDNWARDTDIGVSLEGIIIYGSKLPRDSSQLDSMAQNEGWSNGGRLISWGHIQRLKYTDKHFTIDYYTSSNEQTATVNFKLNHFRFSKDLYFTCIKHHDIFKSYRAIKPATKNHLVKSNSASSCSDDETNSSPENKPNRQPSRKQRIGAITSTQDAKPIDNIPGATLQAAHVRSLRKKVTKPVKFRRTPIHQNTHENLYLIKLYPGPVFDERSNVYGFSFLKNPGTRYPARVSHICVGGSADRSELRKGDQIIQVNNVDVHDFDYQEIQNHIQSVERDVESKGLLILVVISVEEVKTHKNSTQHSLSSQESQTLTLLDSVDKLRSDVQNNKTTDQFFSVPVKRADMTMIASDLPKNLGKNRYKDIKPYDETRVILRPWDSTSKNSESDYINANIVEIKLNPEVNEVSDSLVFNRINSENNTTLESIDRKYTFNDGLSYDDMGDLVSRKYLKYIAAQGPKNDTCSDFWKMMLQNGVQFIVMLTQLQDRGREKCYKYSKVISHWICYFFKNFLYFTSY